MAKGDMVYLKFYLVEFPRLLELDEEKEGTASTIVWEVFKYAYQHKDDLEVPDVIPEAPAGSSLAARHEWNRLIESFHHNMGSYINSVNGGSKAKPGPGRPKGSKNKDKVRDRSDDDLDEDAEDHREPGAGEYFLPGRRDMRNRALDLITTKYGTTLTKTDQNIIYEAADSLRAHLTSNDVTLCPMDNDPQQRTKIINRNLLDLALLCYVKCWNGYQERISTGIFDDVLVAYCQSANNVSLDPKTFEYLLDRCAERDVSLFPFLTVKENDMRVNPTPETFVHNVLKDWKPPAQDDELDW